MTSANPYSSLSEKRILVAGAGVTGIATAKVLADRGAAVTFVDEKIESVEGFEVLTPDAVVATNFDALMISPGW